MLKYFGVQNLGFEHSACVNEMTNNRYEPSSGIPFLIKLFLRKTKFPIIFHSYIAFLPGPQYWGLFLADKKSILDIAIAVVSSHLVWYGMVMV